MDCMIALAEASRVLKPGGVLFLNEVRRIAGDNSDMERILRFRAYPDDALIPFAEAMGLTQTPMDTASVYTEYLREVWPDDTPGDYSEAFAGTEPGLWRFIKGAVTPVAAKVGSMFYRNPNVALQVSGGKDSIAVLFLLRAWWDRLCVFWLNSGNPLDETVKLMEEIKSSVPNFVEVHGRQKEIIAKDGWPFDVVPQAYTTDGNFVFGETPFKVQTRLSCCYRALMLPMHEKMVDLGVTCIIRGKRSAEKDKTPTRTGSVTAGIETVYPIWDWSEQDVFAYLHDQGIPIPESYKYASHSLDCMDCTAWSEEGLERYLEVKDPIAFQEHARKVRLIRAAITEELAHTSWSDDEDLQ
jgi:phosphoadenosine phosphosulfate reductase